MSVSKHCRFEATADIMNIRSTLYTFPCIFAQMDAKTLFDLLADATRRRMLALLLSHGELCVCELVTSLNEIQPKVSRHLALMKEAGLVTARREGTWMHYRIAEPLPAWTLNLLASLKAGAVTEFQADLTRLALMSGRPDRCAA